MGNKFDIYISYRWEDGAHYAHILFLMLEKRGYKVAYDHNTEQLSVNFADQIRNVIQDTHIFIMVLSPHYLDRCNNENDWVRQEIMLAYQLKKYIIPVNPDNLFTNVPSDIPTEIKQVVEVHQHAQVSFGQMLEASIDKLVESIPNNKKTSSDRNVFYDIFLAYPRRDSSTGDKLAEIVRSNGFSVWRDVDGLYAGDIFVDVIKNAITNSKVFIALNSKWALKSAWFNKELAFAQEKKKPIIKVLTDNPEGLSGTRRMSFGSILEMGSSRFEEKLLTGILNNGCKSNTKEMFAHGKGIYDRSQKSHNLEDEFAAFSILLRAAELGNHDAQSYIESQAWNIDLRKAVLQYVPINSYFVKDLCAELYNRGEIIAEDETLTDNAQRGRGMEKASFRMMKRAIDLGYNGNDPKDYNWYFLEEKDFEECLDQLGLSSRIYENKNKEEPKPDSFDDIVVYTHPDTVKSGSEDVIQVERIVEKETAEKLLEEYTPQHVDYDIFISYRRDDAREHARNVQLALRSNGYENIFFDYDSIQDGEFTKRIINAIFSCTDFLLLLSPKSMERCVNQGDPVAYEIRVAKKYNKHIIPMQLNGKEIIWPQGFPTDLEFIKDIHWHDHMTNSYFDESIKKLILRLKTKKQSKHDLFPNTEFIKDDTERDKRTESFEDSVELQLAWIDYNDGNYKEALRSFLLEARQGSANALNAIGLYYYEGKACPKNYQQAISYFRKAADMGYASAMRNLGDCYRWGYGVKQDVEKSIYWYKQAAEKKNLKAIFILAQCYRDIDSMLADWYYLEAAHMGHEEAINYVRTHGLSKHESDIKWNSENAQFKETKCNKEECQCVLTLKHKDAVESAVFSPDGKHIVSASDDNSVCIWDATTGNRIFRLKGHTDSVNCVAYNSDGTRIVSASDDESIRIWETTNGKCLAVLNGHEDSAWSASFSRDGKRVISASADKTIRIWDVINNRCELIMKGHSQDVNYASFSPDGQRIVSASEDGTIRIWDAVKGDCLRLLRGHKDGVWFAKYDRYGKNIVSASADGTIRVWDASSGECIYVLEGHVDDVNSAVFSQNCQSIVSASDDKTIRVWDVLTGKCIKVIEGHTDFVNSAFFSSNGHLIVSASDDCTIKVWGDVDYLTNTNK